MRILSRDIYSKGQKSETLFFKSLLGFNGYLHPLVAKPLQLTLIPLLVQISSRNRMLGVGRTNRWLRQEDEFPYKKIFHI